MRRLAVILTVLIIAAGLFYISTQITNPSLKMPPPNPLHNLTYVGTIGTGKDKVEKGIASLKQNYQKLDYVSLSWYNLDSENKISLDGSVSDEVEKDTIEFIKQNGKKIMFGISDHGEAEKAGEILEDEDDQGEHIRNIISIIDEKGYDGVIIDFEDMKNDQEEDFSNYMQNLSEEIHSKGKFLGISIPVETRGEVTHGINIVDVSKLVDRMHMNVYEQHGQDSGPGPIASIEWTNTIIKNAVAQGVEPNKIVLGTAHSGHDWEISPDEEFFKDMDTRETLELFKSTKAELQWDDEMQANFFTYKDDGDREHIVWLEDAASIKTKIDLAKRYRLQGVFIWYLGGEDPDVWKAL